MSWLFVPQLRPLVALAAMVSFVLNLALLVPAIYMLQIFDRVFASRSGETLLMLSALVLSALALGYFMDTVRARALAWTGRALEERLAPAALAGVIRDAAGPRRTRSVDADVLRDAAQLRAFLSGSGIQALFDAPWLPVYLAFIALMHPLLGTLAALGAVLLGLLAVMTERLTRDAFKDTLARSRASAHDAEGLIRNADAIVGMGMIGAAVTTWQARQRTMLEGQARLSEVTARLGALARIARQGLQAGMLGVGAWLVISMDASAGIMVASTILLGRALQPVEHLITGWKAMIDARGAWQRLGARALREPGVRALALPAPTGSVDVERVAFGPEEGRPPLIRNLSFSLAAGESLGIVGPSASGKTTLVRLLLGIWTPQAGTIRIDGADMSQWDRDALGAHVGYLPQDVELFPGTVAENIARFAGVDAERVIAAARLAHVHEMILRLPDGYQTQVGEAGMALSGGQRQRIGLARALHGAPRLVVLDEPNANLDADGERALVATLAELKARAVTVVIVGHRPAMMAKLDKLAVLNNGVLEAFGAAPAVLSRLHAVARAATPGASTGAPMEISA